jgi:hypothetical protein
MISLVAARGAALDERVADPAEVQLLEQVVERESLLAGRERRGVG